MRLEWSAVALADLNRFAAFLQERHPRLANVVAAEILAKARVLEAIPELGYAIGRSGAYRQVVLEVLRAKYVFRYRIEEDRIVMMRVFHGREKRAAMSGLPMIDVVSVKPLGGYRLRVAFSDGLIGEHDFSSTAARSGEMVRPLKDPAFFSRVFVELGALTWPNGFDLDPINLYMLMRNAGTVAAE